MQDNLSVNSPEQFPAFLKERREARRLSQSRLAVAAGWDASLVARFESGTKRPKREQVLKLASVMGMESGETAMLLASAGFVEGRVENLFANEPVLEELYEFLQDGDVPEDVRRDAVHLVSLLIRQLRRAAVEPI